MADVTYTVEVQYLTSGSLLDKKALAGASSAANQTFNQLNQKLGDTIFKGFNTTFNNRFTNVFRQAAPQAEKHGMSIGEALGLGVAAGLTASAALSAFEAFKNAIKVGLIEMNAEVEQLSIVMSTMFSGSGMVKDFSEGMRASAQLMKTMRKDARELPGEFKDLAVITKSLITPGAAAGMSIGEIEKMAANAMAIGVGGGIDAATVGREVAALLKGQMTSRMPLLRVLPNFNVESKELNSMSQDKRTQRLKLGLGMVAGTKEEAAVTAERAHFMNSWIGLWSTLKDQAKQVLGTLTGELFDNIKSALITFNSWFETNQAKIENWAKNVGHYLADGFNKALAVAMKLEKIIERTGQMFGDRQKTSNLGRDAGTLAGVGVGVSAGRAMFGAVEAAGAMGAEGGALAAIGGISAGPLIAIALAIGGAIEGLTNDLSPLHGDMLVLWEALKTVGGEAIESLKNSFMAVWPIIKRVAEMFGETLLAGLTAAFWAIAKVAKIIEILVVGMTNLFGIIRDFIRDPTGKPGELAFLASDAFKFLDPDANPKLRDIKEFKREVPEIDVHALRSTQKPPQHHTTIHRVEIHVNSNQDPNRIAKRTLDVIRDVAVHPKSYHNSGSPVLSRT